MTTYCANCGEALYFGPFVYGARTRLVQYSLFPDFPHWRHLNGHRKCSNWTLEEPKYAEEGPKVDCTTQTQLPSESTSHELAGGESSQASAGRG